MTRTQSPAPQESAAERKRIPLKEGFFTQPLFPLEQVRLKGNRCRSCGETFLGTSLACENCQSADLSEVVLSRKGKLYTYTVVRHRPPGDYMGPEPFVPYAVGLVELPEELRILSILTGCDPEKLTIGMDLELVVEKLGEDAEGNEIITYKFQPVSR